MHVRYDSVVSSTSFDPCDIKYALDFSGKMTSSNLGGKGPDVSAPPAIIYEDVIPFLGFVDLEVTVTSGKYSSDNTSKNGIFHSFGIINVMSDTFVNLKFRFIDHTTGQSFNNPNSFYFSIFDLDTGNRHRAVEAVLVKDFWSYKTADNTELLVKPIGSYTEFMAQKPGTEDDNPTFPEALTTEEQLDRAVTFLFPPVAEFQMTFGVKSGGHQSRNFLFAGPSTLVCPLRALCSSFTCPSGDLKADAEYIACAGETCVAEDAPTCCCSAESFGYFVPYDLIENTIGERVDGKIILGNILEGAHVNMEVSVLNDFSRVNPNYRGLYGSFGIVTVMANSSVEFKFKFKDIMTGLLSVLPPFRMSILDVDHSAGHVRNEPECREILFAQGPTSFALEPDSKISIESAGEEPHFVSGEVGGRADNPGYFVNLTGEQKRKAVILDFPSVAEFDLTFSVSAGCKHSRSIEFTKPTIIGRC